MKEFIDELKKSITRADEYFKMGDFQKAQELYEELFEEIRKILEESKLFRKIAKGIGWAAAIFTGGFGLEDIFIIPAVSKGIEYYLGINTSELIALLKYISYQELCSITNGKLWNLKDEYYYLKKFALLYQNVDKNFFKIIAELYLPPFSLEEDSSITLIPLIRENAKYIENIEVTVEENIYILNLKELFSAYVSHFKWDFVKGGGRSKNKFSEDEMDIDYACEILGVSRNASKEEIKNAYYKKVSEWHPDKLGDMAEELRKYAEEHLKKINLAYEILTKR